MKILLTLFVLFFSSLVSAVEYPYEGDKPILPNLSADAGEDYEYMRLCGGDLYKSAEETRKRVKELSTPDYKLFQKYRMIEFQKNYSHSINCGGNKWLIEANERYLNNLKRSIDNKSNPQNSTKNKILKNLQEIIYVCVDSNGKHSLRNNSNNSSDTSCTSYTNKDTAQKIVESANSKLEKNKYYVCVDPDTRENSLKVDPDLSIDKCATFQNKNVAQNFLDTSNTKLVEEKEQIAEAKRVAEEKRKEEERIAEEKRKEEERIAEEKRKEEERLAEEKRIEKEKLKALIPIESELEHFQNFINDVIGFFEVNPDEFDVLEIAALLNSSKPILDGQINDDLRIKFNSLKNYVNESEDFISYERQSLEYRETLKIERVKETLHLLEKNIDDLTIYLKANITSNFAGRLSDEIKSSKKVLSSPNTLLEIEDKIEKLSDLSALIKNTDEQINIAENNILKLKLYLQENITSELTPEILEKIDLLNKGVDEVDYDNLSEINLEISVYIKNNNLRTKKDIIEEQERERVAEEKRIAEEKRKAEEKKNEGKHFFTNMLCEQTKKGPPTLTNEEIAVYSTMGIESENLYYINDIAPIKMCECFEEKTKKTFTLERIKEVNSMYKKNPKDPNITTPREDNFFAGLGASCGNRIAEKMEFWMKGGRP